MIRPGRRVGNRPFTGSAARIGAMFQGHADTRDAARPQPNRVRRRDRFELATTVNDLAIGVWFAIGCLFFLGDQSSTTAIWMFFFGSLQMIAGPLLRLWRSRRSPEVPVRESGRG